MSRQEIIPADNNTGWVLYCWTCNVFAPTTYHDATYCCACNTFVPTIYCRVQHVCCILNLRPTQGLFPWIITLAGIHLNAMFCPLYLCCHGMSYFHVDFVPCRQYVSSTNFRRKWSQGRTGIISTDITTGDSRISCLLPRDCSQSLL